MPCPAWKAFGLSHDGLLPQDWFGESLLCQVSRLTRFDNTSCTPFSYAYSIFSIVFGIVFVVLGIMNKNECDTSSLAFIVIAIAALHILLGIYLAIAGIRTLCKVFFSDERSDCNEWETKAGFFILASLQGLAHFGPFAGLYFVSDCKKDGISFILLLLEIFVTVVLFSGFYLRPLVLCCSRYSCDCSKCRRRSSSQHKEKDVPSFVDVEMGLSDLKRNTSSEFDVYALPPKFEYEQEGKKRKDKDDNAPPPVPPRYIVSDNPLTTFRNPTFRTISTPSFASTQDMIQPNEAEELFLRDNDIDPLKLKALLPTILKCKFLVEIDLSFNQLGPDGISALLLAVPKLSKLERLNISHTFFGDEGCKHIAKFLQTERFGVASVHTIDISKNQISTSGMLEIFDALALNKTISTFVSNNNPLYISSLSMLSTVLSLNATLRKVDISKCEIDDTGAEIIATALTRNSTLTSLILTGNSVRKLSRFQKALQLNVVLQEILLDNSNILDRIFSLSRQERQVVYDMSKARHRGSINVSVALEIAEHFSTENAYFVLWRAYGTSIIDLLFLAGYDNYFIDDPEGQWPSLAVEGSLIAAYRLKEHNWSSRVPSLKELTRARVRRLLGPSCFGFIGQLLISPQMRLFLNYGQPVLNVVD